MALPSSLRFGSVCAVVALFSVHATALSAESSDNKCDAASLLQAKLGSVRSAVYDGRSRRSHLVHEHLHEVEPAFVQAEKRLDVVVQSRSQLVSIGTAAEHQQQEGVAADGTIIEQQQPADDAADAAVAEQQPGGDAADEIAAVQQQPEGDAADETADEQQQPEGDTADETVTEQQQPEGDVADASVAEQQQPEDDAADETVTEQQQPAGDAADADAAEDGDVADQTSDEQPQPEGDAADEVVVEQQQPEGDMATPTLTEQQQLEGNASNLPIEVRHNASTVTEDWQSEYPTAEQQQPEVGEESPSDPARPWLHYASGAGLALVVLFAAAWLWG